MGGAIIYFTAEPFLGSLLAVSTLVGVPSFVFVQWVAPFVSEFPEKVSAFHWARTVDRAPMALMNMVSSNINQWTLLTAMLPLVYSMSLGSPAAIQFDQTQKLELLMTLGQSFVGMMFLVNMKLAWWEAAALFASVGCAVRIFAGPAGSWADRVYLFSYPRMGHLGISDLVSELKSFAHGWTTEGHCVSLFARIWRERVMAH